MFKKMVFIISMAFISTYAITVDEILDRMEKNENANTSSMEVTQIVKSSSGRESISKLKSYSMGKGEKSISIYESPARIKGMKILMLNDGDDIWFYSPRTARVRKIASHQKKQSVNGSDFSYEDMSTKDRRKDYNSKLIGEESVDGVGCYKIALTAKDKNSTYPKMTLWIDKKNFVTKKGEMFDESGELWKVLILSGITKKGQYWSANKIEMKNIIKGSSTIMKVDKVEYDIEVNEQMFSERYLTK